MTASVSRWDDASITEIVPDMHKAAREIALHSAAGLDDD
jgi:hypothetical protein